MIDFSTSPSYQNIHIMYLWNTNAIVGIAEMPPNLTKLTLFSYHLNDDPMPKLEIVGICLTLCHSSPDLFSIFDGSCPSTIFSTYRVVTYSRSGRAHKSRHARSGERGWPLGFDDLTVRDSSRREIEFGDLTQRGLEVGGSRMKPSDRET
ncbi:hypothetical protein FCM35_KLT19262 [Carex littledalei]|uniref:Uncharacterized protein n=1 Tax=Carex littledalei TaxID=544730 RepID=A0A833RCD2_9POAL|nr:hypothetical protein FCM35_KLT19262 [Carex littledalei]